jgi:hypothetical protein
LRLLEVSAIFEGADLSFLLQVLARELQVLSFSLQVLARELQVLYFSLQVLAREVTLLHWRSYPSGRLHSCSHSVLSPRVLLLSDL